MIIKFEVRKTCRTPIMGYVCKDDAETIAAVAIAANSLESTNISSDYFMPLSDAVISDEINDKCFSLLPVLDVKSIEVTDGSVIFDVTQQCLYFTKDTANEDLAITMAAVAAAADDIEANIKVEKYPFGWTIEAPADLPKSVLTEFVTGRAMPTRQSIRNYAYN